MIPRMAALEMEEMEWNSGDEEQGGKKGWEVRKDPHGEDNQAVFKMDHSVKKIRWHCSQIKFLNHETVMCTMLMRECMHV